MTNCVDRTNWSNRSKSIETKNLKLYHTTPYWLSIDRELSKSIIEYRDGDIVYDVPTYKLIRRHCLTEDYAINRTPYLL